MVETLEDIVQFMNFMEALEEDMSQLAIDKKDFQKQWGILEQRIELQKQRFRDLLLGYDIQADATHIEKMYENILFDISIRAGLDGLFFFN